MRIEWTGPPDGEVALIGIGVVSPGTRLDVDPEVGARLVKQGRATEVKAEAKATPAPAPSKAPEATPVATPEKADS